MSRRLAVTATAVCLVALVVLSWIPGRYEIRTGAPGPLEHLIAYAGTAWIGTLALPRRRVACCLGLLVMAGILELGQLWIPDRSARPIDFLASSLGAVLGTILAAVLSRALQWRAVRRSSGSGGSRGEPRVDWE